MNRKMSSILLRSISSLCLFTGITSTPAFAVDVNPMDWMPAPNGTSTLILYAPWSDNNKAVINDKEISASLNTALVMPRVVHYFEVNNHPAVVTALLPIGRLWNGSIGGMDLGNHSGVGDLTLAGAIWALSKPKERRGLAIAGYVNVPLGTYDREKPLNLSTGSLSATVQVGNMVALSENFTLETTGDVSFYQKKKNANALGQTRKQDNSYSLQNWLTYNISQTTTVSAGHAINSGGDQYLDGVFNGFNSKKQQARLAITHWLTPTLSIYGQFNQDFDVKGGFKGTSGMFRLVKIL